MFIFEEVKKKIAVGINPKLKRLFNQVFAGTSKGFKGKFAE